MSFSSFSLASDRGEEERFGENTWDTGELLYERLGQDAVRILPTRDEPYGGWSMADVAYHHGGVSRHLADNVSRDADMWSSAVTDLLGPVSPR